MYFNFIKHTRGFESDPTISYNYKFPGFGFAGYTHIWKSLFCYKQDMKKAWNGINSRVTHVTLSPLKPQAQTGDVTSQGPAAAEAAETRELAILGTRWALEIRQNSEAHVAGRWLIVRTLGSFGIHVHTPSTALTPDYPCFNTSVYHPRRLKRI